MVGMDCTVVVLPSVPVLGVVVGIAKVEVATGGEMSVLVQAALVLKEQQDQASNFFNIANNTRFRVLHR